VINHRFGGLCEKILETHQTVLAKRSKDMLRSTKWLGWDLCVKNGIFIGGFLRNSQDTGTNLLFTSISRDLEAKQSYLLQPVTDRNARGGDKKLLAFVVAGATGV
jgi:hypothetical protein